MTNQERRESPRHNLRFQLEIRGIKDGTVFIDQAELINISRGGFICIPNEQGGYPYHEGQVIEIEIMIPAPPTILGKMSIKGKIKRLTMINIDSGGKKEHLLVSVQFLNHFNFFRSQP